MSVQAYFTYTSPPPLHYPAVHQQPHCVNTLTQNVRKTVRATLHNPLVIEE